jgi:hypothetical protein
VVDLQINFLGSTSILEIDLSEIDVEVSTEDGHPLQADEKFYKTFLGRCLPVARNWEQKQAADLSSAKVTAATITVTFVQMTLILWNLTSMVGSCLGATTLSIMTLGITTLSVTALSITTLSISDNKHKQHSAS